MKRTLAILVSLVASTAVADDSNLARDSSPRPVQTPSQEFSAPKPEYRARSRLERTPQLESGVDFAVLEAWYRERFLWSPAELLLRDDEAGEGCLSHVTKREWIRPIRGGLYRYVRRRAVHLIKREYKRQLREEWKRNPSYTVEQYEADLLAPAKAKYDQVLRSGIYRIGGVASREIPEMAAPDPYIARAGPIRIDQDYRLEIDLDALWATEAPEYDPVPGLASPARSLRNPPKRRWLKVKVAPRANVRVGIGYGVEDLLKNYGVKVKFDILPGQEGPLFSSSIRVKIKPDGEVRFTFNIYEKRF